MAIRNIRKNGDEILRKISKKVPAFIYNNLSILFTFLFFTFSLIVFRTTSMGQASGILHIIESKPGKLFIDTESTMLFIFIGIVILLVRDIQIEYKIFNNKIAGNYNWLLQHISYSLLLIYILVAGVFDGGQFIYFAF